MSVSGLGFSLDLFLRGQKAHGFNIGFKNILICVSKMNECLMDLE